MTRQDLRTNEPTWCEYSRQVNGSNAHRTVQWCKDIAPELVGFLSLFAIGAALLVLCGLIVQAVL